MATTSSERSIAWRKANPERAKQITRDYEKRRRASGKPNRTTVHLQKMREENPAKALWIGVRSRARQKGIPFNITVDDIPIPEICPILEVPIVLAPIRHQHGPSIDRIIPALGYVKGNVQVISMRANRMKSDATIDDIRRLLAYMEQHQP